MNSVFIEMSSGEYVVCSTQSMLIGVDMLAMSDKLPLITELNEVLPGQLYLEDDNRLVFANEKYTVLDMYPNKYNNLVSEFYDNVESGRLHAALKSPLGNYKLKEKFADVYTLENYMGKSIEFIEDAKDILHIVESPEENAFFKKDFICKNGQIFLLYEDVAVPYIATVVIDNKSYIEDYLHNRLTVQDLKTLSGLYVEKDYGLEGVVMPYLQKMTMEQTIPNVDSKKPIKV